MGVETAAAKISPQPVASRPAPSANRRMNMNAKKPVRNDIPEANKKNPSVKAALIGGMFTITAALITSVVAPILVEQARKAPVATAAPQSLGPLTPSADPAAVLALGVSLPLDQCPSVAFPAGIDPALNPSQAAQQASEAKARGDTDEWPIVGNDDLVLDLTVTSLVKDSGWTQTGNSVKVVVAGNPELPDHTDALLLAWGCGGGGRKRSFSDINLSTDYETYSQQSTSAEFDFFTLQPGEFEVFSLLFHCQAPGIYRLSFELPYTFSEKTGVVSYRPDRPVICPKAYTNWALEGGNFLFSSEFLWDGRSYQRKP
jgi:hypothetical protein